MNLKITCQLRAEGIARHPGRKAPEWRPGVSDPMQDVKNPGCRSFLFQRTLDGTSYGLVVAHAQHSLQDILIGPGEPPPYTAEGLSLLQGLHHLVQR